MKINGLAFVGIPVTDMQRARAFYEGVLGLKVSEEMMGGKWVEYSLDNNTLAIASVGPEWLPSIREPERLWKSKISRRPSTT
jgi:catechol 2,3-dioxygenase-like lactoylglutathione lyase family enzyme